MTTSVKNDLIIVPLEPIQVLDNVVADGNSRVQQKSIKAS